MADLISVTPTLTIDADELEITAIRSQGAGGQNVNKVATAIQLRFDVGKNESLPAAVRQRLLARADKRLSKEGVLTIKAQEHRTQLRNRQAAVDRLVELIREASIEEAPRRPTRPSRSAIRKRKEEKRQRSDVKKQRGKPTLD